MDYFKLDCFRYNVLVELSPLELEKIYKDRLHPLFKHLEDKHLVDLLSNKWKLTQSSTFSSFFVEWNLKYFFSPHTTLEYQLENYKKYFTVSKAAGLASRNSCVLFCEAIQTEYPDNYTIDTKIHKNYLKRENALELVAALSEEDKYNILYKAIRMGYEYKDLFSDDENIGEGHEHMNIILIADIIFRRPITSQEVVSILDIAKMLKDNKALLDPCYLNHPNVDADWTPSELFSRSCHHLFSLPCNLDTEVEFGLRLTKKLCDVFDKIGFPGNAYVSYRDLYSYEWMKKNYAKYGYSIPCVTVVKSDKHVFVTIDTENEEGGFGDTFLSTMETCPSFIAAVLEDDK